MRMIVTDLDRTLLIDHTHISPYTQRIFTACKQKGMYITFATGRSERSSAKFINIIKPHAVISNGGALVRSGDEVICRASLGLEKTNALIKACTLSTSIGYITADTDYGYYVNKLIDENDPNWADYLPVNYMNVYEGVPHGAYKVTVETSDAQAVYDIAEAYDDIAVTPFTGEGWYQLADNKADKWLGVVALSQHLSIDTADIIAFGDDYNDIKMLTGCGTGVAVSNAIDDVKNIADYICCTSENDGVAHWLEEHVLK